LNLKECFEEGFERPIIKLDGLITQELSQGKKITGEDRLETLRDYWKCIVKQILEQKLYLGVYTELPKKGKEWRMKKHI